MALVVRLIWKAHAVARVALGNLLARWPRALVAFIAVMLGVALVAAVTSGYASARQTILDWNYSWVGHSHVHVQPIPTELWADPRLPESLADEVRRLDGVREVVTRQKEHLLALGEPRGEGEIVYGYGIRLPGEAEVRGAGIHVEPGGRMLSAVPPAPGAPGEVLIERHLADTLHKKVGDTIDLVALTPQMRLMPAIIRQRLIRPDMRQPFTIVGILQRPRFSTVTSQKAFQLRDIVMISQADMGRLFASIGVGAVGLESMDVILTRPTPANVTAAANRIGGLITRYNQAHPSLAQNVEVEGADEKLRQLDRNMNLFHMISRTVGVVALLTAGYIIFTTLGMGMVQRQAELGMLRCVGAGRLQIAVATFAEALPIAAAGIVAGLLLGLAAAWGVIAHYHVFFTRMVVDVRGLAWSAGGGLLAVLAAVALPAYLASRVSPMAASRPQSRRMSLRLDVVLALVGVALIAFSFLTRSNFPLWPTPDRQVTAYLVLGVPSLFFGYFLAAPVLVATIGRVVKFLAAGLLLVRPRLLDDQMQTARWRTAATFCALMVGISMLVNLRVHSESVIRGWELPTRMPPGFLFFFEPIGRSDLAKIESLPQIDDRPGKEPIPLMAFWVRYQPAKATDQSSVEAKFLAMAGPEERARDLIQLSFISVQGNRSPQWALDAVRGGGAILVTREFATRHRIAAGDEARFWRHDHARAEVFTVAGIVESPTMDMAIDFLNVRDRFENLSSGTVIGNVADANRLLAGEYPAAPGAASPSPGPVALPFQTRILLFDFAGAEQSADGLAAAGPPRAVSWQKRQLDQIDKALGAMGVQFYAGSLDELREMIVGEFRGVVGILQKIALWAMAIASLGVGFSMAANVHSRRRQLAVLRAVGMTRFQLARLVLAEAVTIALIGSFLGIVHGLHLAINATYFDRALFGLRPHLALQGGVLALAILFAVGCCLVASLIPAMRAGRTNILAALRQL